MELAGNISLETLELIKRTEKRRDSRKVNEGERSYQIKELRNMHHETLRLAVLGVNNKDIAALIGITPQMVCNILGSEIAKRQLEIMHGKRGADTIAVREQIANLAPLAIEALQNILQNENSSDRNKITAAVDILDRGGYAAPKVIQGQFLTAHLTPEDIQAIKDRAHTVHAIASGNGDMNGGTTS